MKIEIHQICYSQELLQHVPDGFIPLDNSDNLRSDWREYWPIRNYLINNPLSEDTWYGFFSPKFFQKTGLGLNEIKNFININYKNQDIISFSPFGDLSTFFINSIEQGDFFQPGLLTTFKEFIKQNNGNVNLLEDFSPMERTVFCNYFLAKKEFWLKWLHLGEILFSAGENSQNPVGILLRTNTIYGEQNIPMKIFIQERLTDYLLIEDKSISVLPYNAFSLPFSNTPFASYRNELIKLNSLKCSYLVWGNDVYKYAFLKERDLLVANINSSYPFLKNRFEAIQHFNEVY